MRKTENNVRSQVSRPTPKIVSAKAPLARKAAPAKILAKAKAPAKKVMAPKKLVAAPKKIVKTGTVCEGEDCPPQCVPSDIPCEVPPPKITFPCDREKTLTCIPDNAEQFHHNHGVIVAIVEGGIVDLAFPTPEEVAECAQSSSTEECANDFTVTVEDTTTVTKDGLYSVTRIYRVVDACDPQNSALFTFTIYFSVSDGTGPVITISPPVGSVGLPQCSEGTNPYPDCECVSLPGCKPSRATILAALGTGSAEDCHGPVEVTYHDSEVQQDEAGCYKYIVRIFTAYDECCNEGTACRVVRWLDDVIDPTITIEPPIESLPQCDPEHQATQCEIDCECVDLGCNPSLTQLGHTFPTLEDLIDYVLGAGTAHDNCDGVGQVCVVDSEVTGDCCHFSQTRTFTAEDPCGNDVKVCRTVRWKVDLEAPLIQCPADKVLPCKYDEDGAVVPYTEEEIDAAFDEPDVFDRCDGALEAVLVSTVAGEDANGNLTYTRTWRTPDDSCGNNDDTEVSQTITVVCHCKECDDCKGCSQGFWRTRNGQPLWNSLTDEIVLAMPVDRRFTTTTDFWTYFGFDQTDPPCDLQAGPLTMLAALSVSGPSLDNCNNLVRQGVAALLNKAAFGADYCVTFESIYDLTTFEGLYQAIQSAFVDCSCVELAAALEEANTKHNNTICPQDGETTILGLRSGLKAKPVKKVAPKPALKKAVAPKPAKKAIAPKPAKKAVNPAPKKKAAPAPKRKTFVPGNAQ